MPWDKPKSQVILDHVDGHLSHEDQNTDSVHIRGLLPRSCLGFTELSTCPAAWLHVGLFPAQVLSPSDFPSSLAVPFTLSLTQQLLCVRLNEECHRRDSDRNLKLKSFVNLLGELCRHKSILLGPSGLSCS